MSHKHLFAYEDLFDAFNAEDDEPLPESLKVGTLGIGGTGICDAIRMEEIEGKGDTRTAMYRRDHADDSDSDSSGPPPLIDSDSDGPPPLAYESDEESEDSQTDEEDVPFGARPVRLFYGGGHTNFEQVNDTSIHEYLRTTIITRGIAIYRRPTPFHFPLYRDAFMRRFYRRHMSRRSPRYAFMRRFYSRHMSRPSPDGREHPYGHAIVARRIATVRRWTATVGE